MDERMRGAVDTFAVIGVDVVDTGHDYVDKQLILGRGGCRSLYILEDLWATFVVDLNCVHASRLSQLLAYMQENRSTERHQGQFEEVERFRGRL